MRTQTVMIGKGTVVTFSFMSLLCSFVFSVSTSAQNPLGKILQAKANETDRTNTSGPDSLEDERRAFAISLVIINALALVFVLGTLVVPAVADDFELIVEACETGCTGWNAQNGCVYCQKCCTAGDYYTCKQVPNNQCS